MFGKDSDLLKLWSLEFRKGKMLWMKIKYTCILSSINCLLNFVEFLFPRIQQILHSQLISRYTLLLYAVIYLFIYLYLFLYLFVCLSIWYPVFMYIFFSFHELLIFVTFLSNPFFLISKIYLMILKMIWI